MSCTRTDSIWQMMFFDGFLVKRVWYTGEMKGKEGGRVKLGGR